MQVQEVIMIKIAFYGKGGIGKSTTVTNVAVALAQRGLRVLQVGCDPKADSTRLLRREDSINTHADSGRDCFSGENCEGENSGESPMSAGENLSGENNGYCGGLAGENCARESTRNSGAEYCKECGGDSDFENPDTHGNYSEVQKIMHRLRSESPKTVMDYVRARRPFEPEDVVKEGYAGVLCTEAGGPLPGQGCAGRAVITALEKIEELGVYEKYSPDIVLFDVLGDVVCGGFAMPMRSGYADYVYIITSGETMSLYAAANIGLALDHFQGRGYAKNGGLILNSRDVPNEKNKVLELARELGTELTGCLSRSDIVLRSEEKGQCVLQAFPDSEMAEEYRGLADKIAEKIPATTDLQDTARH